MKTTRFSSLAGVATPAQAERLVTEWLRHPARFGGAYPVYRLTLAPAAHGTISGTTSAPLVRLLPLTTHG